MSVMIDTYTEAETETETRVEADFNSNPNSIARYSSDHIRKLFFTIGIIMLLALPIFLRYINTGGLIAMIGILAVDFLAGITNFRRKGVIFSDMMISLVGTAYFEITGASHLYTLHNVIDGYFVFNEIVAILFFITFYISVRVYRGIPR